MSRARGRVAIATFVLLLALGAGLFAVPGHVAARCFGVPEGPIDLGSGWYVNVTIVRADGQRDGARFGAAEGATFLADPGVDELEGELGNRTVLLYFQIPTFRGPRGAAVVLVNVSVNAANYGETAWPLTILYTGEQVQDFRLEWSAEEIAAVPSSWSLTIAPPGVEPFDMRSRNSVDVRLGPGVSNSWITGRNTPPDASASLPAETLVFAGAAYAVLVAFVLVLRANRRKRRGEPDRTPEAPSDGTVTGTVGGTGRGNGLEGAGPDLGEERP